jgi:hypothetical protein
LSIHSWRELLRGAGCPSCHGEFEATRKKNEQWINSVNRAAEEYVELLLPTAPYVPEDSEHAGWNFLDVLETFKPDSEEVKLIRSKSLGLGLYLIDNELYAGFPDPRDYGRTFDQESEIRQEATNAAIEHYCIEHFEEYEKDGETIWIAPLATLPSIYHGNHGPADLQAYLNLKTSWVVDLEDVLRRCTQMARRDFPSDLEEAINLEYEDRYSDAIAEHYQTMQEEAKGVLENWGADPRILSSVEPTVYLANSGLDACVSEEALLELLTQTKPLGWACFMANDHYVFVPKCSPDDPDDWEYGARIKDYISGLTFVLGKTGKVGAMGWMRYPLLEFEVNGQSTSVAWDKIPYSIKSSFVQFLTEA